MERLTIPDKKIPGGVRRAIIDTRAVREEAMTLYWALKKYEDTGLSPEEVEDVNDFNKSQVGHLLKKLSEEQRKHRWIPVKERLPEEDERVILCTRYGTVKEGTYTERYGYAMRKGFFTENCFEELCDVAAWMPLPRPYQGHQQPDRLQRDSTPQERTRAKVYATGNKWAIENFNDTHN